MRKILQTWGDTLYWPQPVDGPGSYILLLEFPRDIKRLKVNQPTSIYPQLKFQFRVDGPHNENQCTGRKSVRFNNPFGMYIFNTARKRRCDWLLWVTPFISCAMTFMNNPKLYLVASGQLFLSGVTKTQTAWKASAHALLHLEASISNCAFWWPLSRRWWTLKWIARSISSCCILSRPLYKWVPVGDGLPGIRQHFVPVFPA